MKAIVTGETQKYVLRGESKKRYNYQSKDYVERTTLELSLLKTAFYEMERSFMPISPSHWHIPLPSNIEKGDAYTAVPFSISNFLSIIIDAYGLLGEGKKFLDVGCGSGMKTKMANLLFDTCGIDIDPECVSFAQKIGNDVELQDALEYKNYGDFDLIYFYSPFKNDDLQRQLEDTIRNQMRTETLIAPIFSVYDWEEFSDMKKHGFLYEKL